MVGYTVVQIIIMTHLASNDHEWLHEAYKDELKVGNVLYMQRVNATRLNWVYECGYSNANSAAVALFPGTVMDGSELLSSGWRIL